MSKFINFLFLLIIFSCTAQGIKTNPGILHNNIGSPEDVYSYDNCDIETDVWNGSVDSNIYEYQTLKSRLNANEPLRIVFVLPVEANNESNFGDAMELIRTKVCNDEIEDNVLFVRPSFLEWPWYANHPTLNTIQQESNTIELINLIKAKYNMFPSYKSHLLGFSKSGYGAMNLLLRYPNDIDGVFIWDSPLAANTFVTLDMFYVFDTVAYLQSDYDLVNLLATNNANLVGKDIHIGGYMSWQALSETFTDELPNYPAINYTIDNTLVYNHVWDIDWITIMLAKENGYIKGFQPPVTSVTSIIDDLAVGVGETYQMNVLILPVEADQTGTWSSSNTGIATIDNSGQITITGTTIGDSATVTFTSNNGGFTATPTTVYVSGPDQAPPGVVSSIVGEGTELWAGTSESSFSQSGMYSSLLESDGGSAKTAQYNPQIYTTFGESYAVNFLSYADANAAPDQFYRFFSGFTQNNIFGQGTVGADMWWPIYEIRIGDGDNYRFGISSGASAPPPPDPLSKQMWVDEFSLRAIGRPEIYTEASAANPITEGTTVGSWVGFDGVVADSEHDTTNSLELISDGLSAKTATITLTNSVNGQNYRIMLRIKGTTDTQFSSITGGFTTTPSTSIPTGDIGGWEIYEYTLIGDGNPISVEVGLGAIDAAGTQNLRLDDLSIRTID